MRVFTFLVLVLFAGFILWSHKSNSEEHMGGIQWHPRVHLKDQRTSTQNQNIKDLESHRFAAFDRGNSYTGLNQVKSMHHRIKDIPKAAQHEAFHPAPGDETQWLPTRGGNHTPTEFPSDNKYPYTGNNLLTSKYKPQQYDN